MESEEGLGSQRSARRPLKFPVRGTFSNIQPAGRLPHYGPFSDAPADLNAGPPHHSSPYDERVRNFTPLRGTFSGRPSSHRSPFQESFLGSHVQTAMFRPQTVNPSHLRVDQEANIGQFAHSIPPYPQNYFPFANTALSATQRPFPDHSFQFRQSPFTAPGFEESLSVIPSLNEPLVHEGFIPAPGNEADGEFEALDQPPIEDFRLSLFDDWATDDEDEADLEAEEEKLMWEIEQRNDNAEVDLDFSLSDADDVDDDPDEMLPEADADEEDDEDGENGSQRPRPSTKAVRGRSSRRGRPPRRGRGGRLTQQAGEGKRGRPRGRRGPRAIADPGPQFKDLQRRANEAYLAQDFTRAVDYISDAIKLNPEIFAAHSLLAEIYQDMGDEQKVIEALIVGAPTKRDKKLWFYIIDLVKQIGPEKYPIFTDSTKRAVVLDCLRAIILLDPDDYDARYQKLVIESRLGHVSRAVKLCRKMLTMRPFDDEVLKKMARLGTSTAKQTGIHLERMLHTFETSIKYFMAHDEPHSSNLDWSLLNVYLDLIDRSGDYVHGIHQAKMVARWIQNRKEETYWNDQHDDREFDLEDEPRRSAVLEFSRVSFKTKYGKTLPLEIRVKMGLFRLRNDPSDFEESMRHLEILEPEGNGPDAIVLDYPDLFREIADSLHLAGHELDALRFYQTVYDMTFEELGLRDFIGMYTCFKNLDVVEKADEMMPIFLKWKPKSLEELAVLAKFFEDHEMEDEAFKRGESVYKEGGARILQNVGFRGLAEIQGYVFQEKKRARGKHGLRNSRVKSYLRTLKMATGDTGDSDEADDTSEEVTSLGPMSERPKPGLFRTRKHLLHRRPKAFLPDEIPGTNVPNDAIDHSLFLNKLHRLAEEFPEELKAARAQHREIVASFQRLEELCEAAEDGNEASTSEWVSIARELIEEFSTFDLFYYDRRHDFTSYFKRIATGDVWKESALMVLAVVANNVEDGQEEPEIIERPDKPPCEFYGIHFDKWFDTFAQYAIFMARAEDEERCFSTMDVALQSNIFSRSQTYNDQLHLCRLGCALFLGDSSQASSALRWFMRTYPFSGDMFRLYGGVNRFCPIPNGFATDSAHKVFMRYIKTMDYAILSPEQREMFNFRGRDQANWMAKAVSTDFIDYVYDHDPALFALFGHVLMCGGGYMTALNYYFRALALTPEDPLLNLAIGVAYIQHGMKRLSENRQFQIQQGLSFVYRYHELRTKDQRPVHWSEAEFNMGRIWHALGLVHQALLAYERCIHFSKQVQEEAKESDDPGNDGVEDFATEAAYATQSIYALSGHFEGARRVTEMVLVIE